MKYKGIIREVKLLARGQDKYIFLKTEIGHDSDINNLRDLIGKYVVQEINKEDE